MSKYSSYLGKALVLKELGVDLNTAFQYATDGAQHIIREIGHVIEQFSPDDAALIIVALRYELNSMERLGGEHAVDLANKFMDMTECIDLSHIVKGGSDHE